MYLMLYLVMGLCMCGLIYAAWCAADREEDGDVLAEGPPAPLIDDEPTIPSSRTAELAAEHEKSERYRRWFESLPEEVACETPADEPTVMMAFDGDDGEGRAA